MKANKQTASSNTISNKSEKDNKTRIERCKYNYDLVNMWIGSAENKVGISCGIYSVVFGIVTFLSTQFGKVTNQPEVNQCWKGLYIVCLVAGIIAMTVAIIFYAIAIIPNLKSNSKEPINKAYPIFYGDIASLTQDKYKELIQRGKDEDFIEELILETHFNSQICLKKMGRFKVGVLFSNIAIGLAFCCLLAHFMMYS